MVARAHTHTHRETHRLFQIKISYSLEIIRCTPFEMNARDWCTSIEISIAYTHAKMRTKKLRSGIKCVSNYVAKQTREHSHARQLRSFNIDCCQYWRCSCNCSSSSENSHNNDERCLTKRLAWLSTVRACLWHYSLSKSMYVSIYMNAF